MLTKLCLCSPCPALPGAIAGPLDLSTRLPGSQGGGVSRTQNHTSARRVPRTVGQHASAPSAGPHPVDVHPTSHISSPEPQLCVTACSAFLQRSVLCDKGATSVGDRVTLICIGVLSRSSSLPCQRLQTRLVCHSGTFHPSIQPIKIQEVTFKSLSGLQGIVRSPGRPRVGAQRRSDSPSGRKRFSPFSLILT